MSIKEMSVSSVLSCCLWFEFFMNMSGENVN